ncbi:hypothetical protein, partial [Shewanella sp. SR44-3]|uniref:hypothetical protein n=1 Tax=Shewanella sp. SR44-3 TaxID=2760936 RepID=UPI0015FC529C
PPPPPPPPPATIGMSGKVIDGYVKGATVWLDINGNSVFDTDSEPSVISGDAGEYAFEFTEEQAECVAYSTLYVDVPVGAIDEDSGAVTEPYQMALPPSITPLTDDEIRHVSPLTSVLWEQIAVSLNTGTQKNLSCESLKENVQLRGELQTEIRSVMSSLVAHYNLSEAQIFADFIADDNSQAYDIAQAIVIGLKAAFSHRAELKTQYPDAREIRVVIYQDNDKDHEYQFDKAWYRDTVVFTIDGYLIKGVKLKQDLNEVDIVLTDLVALDKPWGDQSLTGKLRVRKDAYYKVNGTYSCTGFEQVNFKKDAIEYKLSNSPDSTYADTLAECETSFETPFTREHLIYFNEGDKSYFAEFHFREGQPEFKSLADWVNLKDKAEQLNAAELIEHLSLLPKGWDEEVLIDTTLWRKRQYDNTVRIDKDSKGKWTKATRQDDGTTVYECSTDGVTWASCNT